MKKASTQCKCYPGTAPSFVLDEKLYASLVSRVYPPQKTLRGDALHSTTQISQYLPKSMHSTKLSATYCCECILKCSHCRRAPAPIRPKVAKIGAEIGHNVPRFGICGHQATSIASSAILLLSSVQYGVAPERQETGDRPMCSTPSCASVVLVSCAKTRLGELLGDLRVLASRRVVTPWLESGLAKSSRGSIADQTHLFFCQELAALSAEA